MEYRFDFGDGAFSDWTSEQDSSAQDTGDVYYAKATHTWNKAGRYAVRSQARSKRKPKFKSRWTAPLYITVVSTGPITAPKVLCPMPGQDTVATVNILFYLKTAQAYCSNGDPVEYRFDFGDTTLSEWGSDTDSLGESRFTVSYSWKNPGSYFVYAQARSKSDPSLISQWVGPLSILVGGKKRE